MFSANATRRFAHGYSINQADFCVTPTARASSQEEMLLRSPPSIHIAGSHLSIPSGESSKIFQLLSRIAFLGVSLGIAIHDAMQRTRRLSRRRQDKSPRHRVNRDSSPRSKCGRARRITRRLEAVSQARMAFSGYHRSGSRVMSQVCKPLNLMCYLKMSRTDDD
jgi:hypothetical protein